MLMAHLNHPAPDPGRLRPMLSRSRCETIQRAMNKDPAAASLPPASSPAPCTPEGPGPNSPKAMQFLPRLGPRVTPALESAIIIP
jgi:hypothetical protein